MNSLFYRQGREYRCDSIDSNTYADARVETFAEVADVEVLVEEARRGGNALLEHHFELAQFFGLVRITRELVAELGDVWQRALPHLGLIEQIDGLAQQRLFAVSAGLTRERADGIVHLLIGPVDFVRVQQQRVGSLGQVVGGEVCFEQLVQVVCPSLPATRLRQVADQSQVRSDHFVHPNVVEWIAVRVAQQHDDSLHVLQEGSAHGPKSRFLRNCGLQVSGESLQKEVLWLGTGLQQLVEELTQHARRDACRCIHVLRVAELGHHQREVQRVALQFHFFLFGLQRD